MTQPLHATCVAIGGRGVLLLGPPGAGKSDLALRLIDRGAMLVSDDGTLIEARDGWLHASAPAIIAGKLEVRGLGIVELPALADAPLALAILLGETAPRMPPEPLASRDFAGLPLPCLSLDPFESSAPVKVEQGLMLYGLAP